MRHSSRSLTAHLRETEDHARLPFHAACPVCRRDRLAGSLDGEELVSRRTQAAIAAGLLAFSTGGVSVAAAQVPDEVTEGTTEVVVGGDPTAGAEFDPGDETVQLPDEAPLTTDVAATPHIDEDDGPLEQEPADDVHEPVVEATEPPAEPLPTAAPDTAVPAPTPAPVTAEQPAEGEVLPARASAGPRAFEAHRREAPRRDQPRRASRAAPRTDAAAAHPAPATAPATAPAEPAAATSTTVHVARSSESRAASGDRIHTVRPGESLWSIAADLLGKKATVASIAREVNRLWELNQERIGTGQPDLLLTGTRLMLR